MSLSLSRLHRVAETQPGQLPSLLVGGFVSQSVPEHSMPRLDGLRVFLEGSTNEREFPTEGEWTCFEFDFRAWAAKLGSPPQVEVYAFLNRTTRPSPASIRWLIRDDWMTWLGHQYAPAESVLVQQKYGVFFLPPHFKSIVANMFDERARGAMHAMYRSAKCLELLCETLKLWLTDGLVPRPSGSTIPLNEHIRLIEARTLIAENYQKKLTITEIGRACGLNRSKLTRGFKELFKATVWEVLTGERLSWAAKELRGSDKPIASISFEAGYTNSASFTRAFTKQFGIPPGKYRDRGEVRAA